MDWGIKGAWGGSEEMWHVGQWDMARPSDLRYTQGSRIVGIDMSEVVRA